jgi:hypothetical protein
MGSERDARETPSVPTIQEVFKKPHKTEANHNLDQKTELNVLARAVTKKR